MSTILAFTAAGTVAPGPGHVIGFVAGSIAALGGAAFGIGALSVASTVAASGKAWDAGQIGLTSAVFRLHLLSQNVHQKSQAL